MQHAIGSLTDYKLKKELQETEELQELQEAEELQEMDSLEVMHNEYVASILHTAFYIVRDDIEKEFSMCLQHEVIGEKSSGRVQFRNKGML